MTNERTALSFVSLPYHTTEVLNWLEAHKNKLTPETRNKAQKILNQYRPKFRRNNFAKFANHLVELTQNNQNMMLNLNSANQIKLYYKNSPRTFIWLDPAENKGRRGVEISYGGTNTTVRGSGRGTRLRNYAVKAARSAGVPLWQYGINLNFLVPSGTMPISTRIMRKLGAVPTRGIPRKGKIVKKAWASLVRGHRYPTRR